MIIGTAGHIDHGKTTLIRALTGVDTDRLAEEKRRGITIELGFAYLPCPDGRILGFVDVPGHEKFVPTMTAGASGIEHAILVIAADDGIMPQTREHLGILRFMAVKGLTIALTKIDRVEPERIAARCLELQAWLADTVYAQAAIFPVAATTGQGILELRQHLLALPEAITTAASQGVRYAFDRCFVLAGQGVTVSGLLHTGQLHVGDILTLSPLGLPVRIRSIHAQNQAVPTASAGSRCGLVLAGVEKEQLERGQWLLAHELHAPCERFDAMLTLTQDRLHSLREGLEIMVHHGAARCPARLILLDHTEWQAGASGLVQCSLSEALPLFWHDRIVVRDMSGQHTLAGGLVLDVQPPLRGRKKPERWAILQALTAPQPAPALLQLLQLATLPLSLRTWALRMNLPLASLLAALQAQAPDLQTLEQQGDIWCLLPKLAEQLQEQVQTQLAYFHQQQADEPGLSRERLRRMTLPNASADLFSCLVEHWLHHGVLAQTGSFLHAPEHVLSLTPEEQHLWEQLLPMLQIGQFDPPWVRDLAEQIQRPEAIVRQVLCKQTRRGELHQIVHDLFYTPLAIQALAAIACEQAQPLLNVVKFRDQIGIGRKRAIQILEFFDRIGFTRRIVGEGTQGKRRDERLLRNPQLFSPN